VQCLRKSCHIAGGRSSRNRKKKKNCLVCFIKGETCGYDSHMKVPGGGEKNKELQKNPPGKSQSATHKRKKPACGEKKEGKIEKEEKKNKTYPR